MISSCGNIHHSNGEIRSNAPVPTLTEVFNYRNTEFYISTGDACFSLAPDQSAGFKDLTNYLQVMITHFTVTLQFHLIIVIELCIMFGLYETGGADV